MTLYGYDAAYQPDLTSVKAAGGIAVNGYLTGRYATTTSTPAHALAAGLGWWATYEEDPAELVDATRAVGQQVGQKILAAFKALRDNTGSALPLDGSLAVYPSVDTSVLDPTACDQAWLGLRDVLAGKVSVRYYGQGSIGDHLRRSGLLDGPFWLAAPTSWPGYSATDPNVCVVQEVGTNVPSTDRNHLITNPSALGALWPDGSPYGGDVSQADVIAALQSNEGKQAILNALRGEFEFTYPGQTQPVLGTVDGILRNELVPVIAKVSAILAAVGKLSAGQAQDLAAVTAAAEQGAAQALASYQLTLTKGA